MSKIQAIAFPITFKKSQIIDFLYKHQYEPIKPMRIEGNYYRVRLEQPEQFKRYTTKILPDGIHLIIGYY